MQIAFSAGDGGELPQWFRTEVKLHESILRSYLRASFPSVQDIDNIVQESFVRIWKVKVTRSVDSAKSFLFRIARNLAIDEVRRYQASPVHAAIDLVDLSAFDDNPDAAEQLCHIEETELLRAAIQSLPPRCREIFISRKLEGRRNKDIAKFLGITEGTVEVQITRGIKLCREYLIRNGVFR